ncbi:MAG TPA: tetratricopeptide repeat protein [Thermoanaerobaculaceae bacterium]|nr:tetratricopeptide repeat protein [Thermoanaerobaculaceae bacterium]
MGLLAAIVLAAGCASSGTSGQAHGEMREGVRAAQRSYWQEALFRFQHANALKPSDPEILNNLAVALEALGRYDEALATYKQALQGSSKPTALRRNYARFAEFYSSYAKGVKPKEPSDASH